MANPADDCKRFLTDVEYPAGRGNILAAAQRGNAPRHFFRELQNLPEKSYDGVTDVAVTLGQLRTRKTGK